MRKNKVLLITLLLVCSLFTFASAADNSDVVVSLQLDNPIMEVNGVETEIDARRGTAPTVQNGRTLVPIRAMIEAFGGSVAWDGASSTVSLAMDDDTVKLVINSDIAYFNNSVHNLDSAPRIINGRTMLPIRFVAESFNLGVAWDGDTRTVTVIRNSFDKDEYEALMSVLPEYSGKPYAVINNDNPYFEDYEIISGSFEYYSKTDDLGRCDVCMASVDEDIMPTEERGSISSVKPTGWQSVTYDVVDGGYLYNRCHLIGFQLTGENANRQNLITGTRYMNVDGMLPFENMVADYIESTGNSVMYRVTPVFENGNLVAEGVLMEAYSVEDNGDGISFCVFCYNVQPGVEIDYLTGNSYQLAEVYEEYPIEETTAAYGTIYRTLTGKRYHLSSACGGANSYQVTINEALAAGLTPCKKCAQ